MLGPISVLCVYTYLHACLYNPMQVGGCLEMRCDEHETTGYLDVMADVRWYKLKSSFIYLFYRYILCDGDHSVFHK